MDSEYERREYMWVCGQVVYMNVGVWVGSICGWGSVWVCSVWVGSICG